MAQPINLDAAASFDPLRPKLIRVAYRMLGSVADAEDIVQEAFIRWLGTDRTAVQRAASLSAPRRHPALPRPDEIGRKRREVYPGPWLPEPIVENDEDEVDDVTLPLMMALERLSPLERAAFILHDVFGIGFDEIADAAARPAACRQLASRARANVRADRPRFDVPKERGLGDRRRLFRRLPHRRHDDAAVDAHGRCRHVFRWRRQEVGCQRADHRPRYGDAAACFAGASVCTNMSRILRYGLINGLPGFVTLEADDTLQTTALQIEDGKVVGIYITRNPDKLGHLPEATVH